MHPTITLHYQLSDTSYTELLTEAEGSVHRHQQVTIVKADAPDLWPTLARNLPFADNGSSTLAAAGSNRKKGLDGKLDGFPAAEKIWTPAEAAQALTTWLQPLCELDDLIARLEDGHLPAWVPTELAAGPWADGLPVATIYQYRELRRAYSPLTALNSNDPARLRRLLSLETDDVTLAQPVWPGVARRGGADYDHELFEEAGIDPNPDTLEQQLQLGDTIHASITLRPSGNRAGSGGVRLCLRPSEQTEAQLEAASGRVKARRRAAYQEAQAAASDRAAREQAEIHAWIAEHGSERLRRIVAADLLDTSMAVYRDERLAQERPGWIWADQLTDRDWDTDRLTSEPRNVSEPALDLLETARTAASDATLRYADPDLFGDDGYLAVAEFLDRPILLLDEHLAELHADNEE